MTAPEPELRRSWRRIAGTPPVAGSDALFESLLARHREPHRRYHTVVHVLQVMREATRLAPLVDTGPVDIDAVRAAVLFHDAVYDPRSTTNEADSAGMARQYLGRLGWPPERVSVVERLVLATATVLAGRDDGPVDPATAVMLDADLAVLGAAPEEYRAYADGVRAEYAHLDDDAWCRGRTEVLQRLLGRRPIYLTAMMRDERERRARANLTAELAALARMRSG